MYNTLYETSVFQRHTKVRSAAAEILRVPHFSCRGTSRTSFGTKLYRETYVTQYIQRISMQKNMMSSSIVSNSKGQFITPKDMSKTQCVIPLSLSYKQCLLKFWARFAQIV